MLTIRIHTNSFLTFSKLTKRSRSTFMMYVVTTCVLSNVDRLRVSSPRSMYRSSIYSKMLQTCYSNSKISFLTLFRRVLDPVGFQFCPNRLGVLEHLPYLGVSLMHQTPILPRKAQRRLPNHSKEKNVLRRKNQRRFLRRKLYPVG